MSMICWTLVTSTTVCGEEVMPPNQFFRVAVLISGLTFEVVSFLGLLRGDGLGRHDRRSESWLHQLGKEPSQAYAEPLVGRGDQHLGTVLADGRHTSLGDLVWCRFTMSSTDAGVGPHAGVGHEGRAHQRDAHAGAP